MNIHFTSVSAWLEHAEVYLQPLLINTCTCFSYWTQRERQQNEVKLITVRHADSDRPHSKTRFRAAGCHGDCGAPLCATLSCSYCLCQVQDIQINIAPFKGPFYSATNSLRVWTSTSVGTFFECISSVSHVMTFSLIWPDWSQRKAKGLICLEGPFLPGQTKESWNVLNDKNKKYSKTCDSKSKLWDWKHF